MEQEITYNWTVTEHIPETPEVTTLVLTPQGERPSFLAGQYLTVLLPGYDPVEGKAYSISSAPHEEGVTLTIKRMGQFSSALLDLPKGATLTTSAPYGFFYPEDDDCGELVFLAGGIGVTPAWSIIKQLAHEEDDRSLRLCYSNPNESGIAFREPIVALEATHAPLTVTHFITQDTPTDPTHHAGRMTAETLLESLADPAEALFFLSGSMHFTRGLWNELRAAGVAPEQLYTEGFF